MGAALVFAGFAVGAVTLKRGDREEGPLVWLAFGLIAAGLWVLKG
jgi:hypothetical protein